MPAAPASPSLSQKIGQLLLLGFRGSRPEECDPIVRDLRAHHVGSIILFDQDMTGGSVDTGRAKRNIESPAQVRELIAHLQGQAGRPLLVAIDQEGGRVNRLKPAYGFPESLSHAELGQLDQPAETYRHAGIIARTLAGLGINLNLAPVVDLDAHPDNPIIRGKGRAFSSDPEAVARHAAEFVRAHRAHGVLTCAKHFPGHGSATGDTHLGLVDVTRTWQERELIPFQRLITGGLADVIMTAHVFNARLDPAVPATLSAPVLTGLLRGRLGFEGVICTDDMEMKAIAAHYGLETAVPAAVEAGADLLCFGNNLGYDPAIAGKAADILARAVQSGRISEERIEVSYQRILALKRKIGLIS